MIPVKHIPFADKVAAVSATLTQEQLNSIVIQVKNAMPKITVGTDQPSAPSINDIWIDTN